MAYTLAADGDGYEQHAATTFLYQFPSYEKFWVKHVVPLSNRGATPPNIHFKTDVQLKAIGKGDHDLAVAQLNYSVLRNVFVAFDLMKPGLQVELFALGIARLVAAQDCAMEMLGRLDSPSSYEPWLAQKDKTTGKLGGMEARRTWQNNNSALPTYKALEPVRDYRNDLLHGRMLPAAFQQGGSTFVPDLGKQRQVFDWRTVTTLAPGTLPPHFAPCEDVLKKCWDLTITFLEDRWQGLP